MADIIRLLPDNIANQIAAGEVVQRPASAVKELMENSVDAGATSIRLFIRNGGKSLIQVVDDGIGMSETDARMCFERHATSKIRAIDDLYHIHTLGFRGEAMASIAAVAQVELRTKRTIDDTATCVLIENSEVKNHESCAGPAGTSIAVRNLFFNVPARRSFLKSNQVELRHITDEFLRVALAHPEIHFIMYNEDEEVYHLRPGNLRQRIVAIWGKKYDEILVPVEESSELLGIKGFIGKPEFARKTRGEQYFFANNRYIRSPYLHHAVLAAYEGLLQSDAFPFYIIFLQIDPARIDINVHPTKTEIKFIDEKGIYAMLRSAARRSLGQHHIAPALNFDEEMSIPSIGNSPIETSTIRSNPTPSGWNQQEPRSDFIQRTKAKPEDWQELYKVLSMAQPEQKEEEKPDEILEVAEPEQKPLLQLHQKYIISTIRSGLMIVQQQLAHERILFEKYLVRLAEGKSYSQRLLFPEVVEFDGNDFSLMKEILPEIRQLGFELDEFGKNAFLLNGVPPDLKQDDNAKTLEKILEDYKSAQQLNRAENRENLAKAMARNGGIKVGRSLTSEEMKQLIDELFACRIPYYSPDGKPVLITIATEELDKKFKK